MQLKIQNGLVELSGIEILSSVNFEINDNSKIAVVGRNGSGKTTLLKLISGEYSIAKKDGDENSSFSLSGKAKIGVLSQIAFEDEEKTLLEEIREVYSHVLSLKTMLSKAEEELERNSSPENVSRYTALLDKFTLEDGFFFEKEYELALKKFGFLKEDKERKIKTFSGGQRTKIAFLKLLLSKPDVLLLDEPTNHLDINGVEWLEEYLKNYKKAFVVVSHDRMFIDNVAKVVYEIERGKTTKYVGNYTDFIKNKQIAYELLEKNFSKQEKEKERLNALVERFRYKATKASMAQSLIKKIDKMTDYEKPEEFDTKTFSSHFSPLEKGGEDVLKVNNLSVGYGAPLSTINLEIKRGDKVGIIGGNGLGKSTFLKTLVGETKALSGAFRYGDRISVGYFDQQIAQKSSESTILEDFLSEFPTLSNFEARSALGAFCFSGDEVLKKVKMLSGGERVRLALCKIFKRQPNFLILDEPTNHMDIIGKEALEDMLLEYEGTVLFVSHDRYFIKKISNKLLSFESGTSYFYPFGYDEYLQKKVKPVEVVKLIPPEIEKPKNNFKLKKEVEKLERKIESLENKIKEKKLEYGKEENASNYELLISLQGEIDNLNEELNIKIEEWEELAGQI